MMKITLTTDTMADGKPVTKGQTVEVSEAEGKILVSEKKAKKISKGNEPEAEQEIATEPIEISEPEPVTNEEAEELEPAPAD